MYKFTDEYMAKIEAIIPPGYEICPRYKEFRKTSHETHMSMFDKWVVSATARLDGDISTLRQHTVANLKNDHDKALLESCRFYSPGQLAVVIKTIIQPKVYGNTATEESIGLTTIISVNTQRPNAGYITDVEGNSKFTYENIIPLVLKEDKTT